MRYPAVPRLPTLVITHTSYSDPKSKQNKFKVTNLKKCQKIQVIDKTCKYEMDRARTVSTKERTPDAWRTDGRSETIIQPPPPPTPLPALYFTTTTPQHHPTTPPHPHTPHPHPRTHNPRPPPTPHTLPRPMNETTIESKLCYTNNWHCHIPHIGPMSGWMYAPRNGLWKWYRSFTINLSIYAGFYNKTARIL